MKRGFCVFVLFISTYVLYTNFDFSFNYFPTFHLHPKKPVQKDDGFMPADMNLDNLNPSAEDRIQLRSVIQSENSKSNPECENSIIKPEPRNSKSKSSKNSKKKSKSSKNPQKKKSKRNSKAECRQGSSKSLKIPFRDKCLKTFNTSINYYDLESTPNFKFLKSKKGKKYKKILAFNYEYGRSFELGFGEKPFEAACCKEKRCFITDNTAQIPFEEFDAVLVHFRLAKRINSIKDRRQRNQRWIFYESEPPPTAYESTLGYEGVFNWTMTYRRDSDIVSGYGKIYNKKDFTIQDFSKFEEKSSLESVMNTKKKLAVWMVSNCGAPSRRAAYASEMQKYIPVDVYGLCGTFKCERSLGKNCYEAFEKDYFFYLSFESNNCKDYITEKFFNILRYYIVPVVRGSGDYKAIAPPHSYIDVRDFKSMRELANYLTDLFQNSTAYMEYFKWKEDYLVVSPLSWYNQGFNFCSLCHKLHNDCEEKIYNNLTDWFLDSAECNKF